MDINIPFYKMSKAQKTQLYMDNLTVIFNPQALFSDGTAFYRNPSEPDCFEEVHLRFRTGRENVDEVILVFDEQRYTMQKVANDKMFDYYEYTVKLGDSRVEYYFEVHSGHMVCYFNSVGVCSSVENYYNFSITPSFQTPDWAKGAIIYQIFVDRFYNGDRSNDVETDEYFYIGEGTHKNSDWMKYPREMDVREFYGGDIAGVMQKLDYLQDLGVEAIYLNPIFVSPSNHKYDIQDYDYIDPHFGRIVKNDGENLQRDENGNLIIHDPEHPNKDATRYICRVTDKENLEASNQLFIEFVEEVHRRGMKVILDGVFNHCGSFNKWLDRECIYEDAPGYEKGAFVSKDSPYRTFFKFREDTWPYNVNYDGWWGHDTLPKLNYEESPKLYEYIMRIARKWVSPPYNVDGWRLDVAADLGQTADNHHFWHEFRRNVKEANPNAIVLAEHYGDPTEWLKGDQWDTVMNYDAFMEPLTWFLTGVEKHSDEYRGDLIGNADAFFGSMRHYMTRFNTQSLQVAMNELSNHDHSRFLTRTNHQVGRISSRGADAANEGVNKNLFRMAVLMQMTWPGAPTIYYGDEAGLCGWTDPDSRRAYPWGHEDEELIQYHKELIRIHKEHQVLRTGSILFLFGEYQCISYGRFDDNEHIVVAINISQDTRHMEIPVWRLGVTQPTRMARVILTDAGGFSIETKVYQVQSGKLILDCPPETAVLVKDIGNLS